MKLILRYDWERYLLMRKILVTGANGYIGRYVVKTLLDFGYEVIACDIFTDKIDRRAHIIDNYDIFMSDSNTFDALGRPDAMIHLAWKDGFIHNSPTHIQYLAKHFDFIANIVTGGCKDITVMGTMHEIGFHIGMIDSNTPTNPRSLYAISKNSLRQSLEVLNQITPFHFRWLRGYYIYGDDKESNSIFGKLLYKAEEGAVTFPFTTGKNKYDFIMVTDIALQIALASTQVDIDGIINCCSGNPVSLGVKVEEFIKDKGLSIQLEYGVFPERVYDSPEIYGDNSKIKKILERSKGFFSAEIDEKIDILLMKLA